MFGRRLGGEGWGVMMALSALFAMVGFMLWRMGERPAAAWAGGLILMVWLGGFLAAAPGPAGGFIELGGRIVSPEGWWVEPAGPRAVRYGEAGLTALVGARLLSGRALLRLLPGEVRIEGAEATETLRRRIVERVALAYRRVRQRVEIG